MMRVGRGDRGMRRAPELGVACPWCPGPGKTPATHFGTIGERVVVSGCEWHMRLFRRDGELRALCSREDRARRRG